VQMSNSMSQALLQTLNQPSFCSERHQHSHEPSNQHVRCLCGKLQHRRTMIRQESTQHTVHNIPIKQQYAASAGLLLLLDSAPTQ
jgi:hypothetical protein